MGEWIPCSERLPETHEESRYLGEKYDEVMVTLEYRETGERDGYEDEPYIYLIRK